MNKGFLSIFFSLAAFAILASGQQPGPSPTTEQFGSDTSKDDILILVNVTAKELKFDIVPNTTVEFPGTRHRTTIWLTQRQNLPEKMEPGVTYRNVGIQLRISSRFADIERIVQEALGEIPITEEPPKDSSITTSPAHAPAQAPAPTTSQPKSKP